MARTKTNKEEENIIEKIQEKQLTTDKKARPNYYWIRPKVTEQDAYGLNNYGLSKWRDTLETIPCARDNESGRWLTGLDEFDPKITSIKDVEEREKKQSEIRELREQLERLTGLNLSPNNDNFWGDYLIVLSDKSRPFVPHINPKDRIAIEVLKRRGDIPFGADDLYNARYVDAKFYIETEEAEQTNKNSRRKYEKEAIAASFELENDYDKLWKVCYLLGLTKTFNESLSSLIGKVDEYIERNKKYSDELDKLIRLVNLDNIELDGLTIFRKAVRANIVRFDASSKVYYRGGFNMKGSELESVKFLLLPENSGEYGIIVSEVSQKEGISGAKL